MTTPRPWSAWNLILGFGLVSLAGDMVYEGARSVTGPLLGELGASAWLVGLVVGIGEATALLLRLVFGPAADRSGRHWDLALLGYAMTAAFVPLLGVAVYMGQHGHRTTGLCLAIGLWWGERLGKAVRSPSKSVLLASASQDIGWGRGMGVHKALDQIGAFSGPLVVAAVIAMSGLALSQLVLVIPGAAAVWILILVRRHAQLVQVPPPRMDAGPGLVPLLRDALGAGLGREFVMFAASSAAIGLGSISFAIVSYHLVAAKMLPLAGIPVLYAGSMAAGAVAALVAGLFYDRMGGAVLLAVPVLVALVPWLAFSPQLGLAVVGVLAWGAAAGITDSTVKALVADLVEPSRLAGAYGVFAAVQGAAAVVAGPVAGGLYQHHLPILITFVVITQVIAAVLLGLTLTRKQAGIGAN